MATKKRNGRPGRKSAWFVVAMAAAFLSLTGTAAGAAPENLTGGAPPKTPSPFTCHAVEDVVAVCLTAPPPAPVPQEGAGCAVTSEWHPLEPGWDEWFAAKTSDLATCTADSLPGSAPACAMTLEWQDPLEATLEAWLPSALSKKTSSLRCLLGDAATLNPL